MSLYNIETHLSCKNYATDTTSLFRQYHLSVGELLPSCNDRHSALVYVAEGSLFLEWGCLPRRTIEAGTLFLAPMNLHVSGTAAYRIDDIDHYETPDKEFYRFDLESAQGDVKVDVTLDGTVALKQSDMPAQGNGQLVDAEVTGFISSKYPGARIVEYDYDKGLLEV